MKGKLLALLLLCAVWVLSACGAAPSGVPEKSALPDTSVTEESAPDASLMNESAPDIMEPDAFAAEGLEPDESAPETFDPEETGEETFVTGESAGETFVTGETVEEAFLTGETVEEAFLTGETAGETFVNAEPSPDANVLASPERPSFAMPGTWHSDVGADILTIYENGGFELTDASSYYEGYLLYTDEDGGPWESGPRYEMYLENNERLPNASLTWDDGHPGKLVYVVGGGAELFSRGDCAYDEDGIAVRARWADENVLSAYADYDEYAAYSGEYEADILYVTERTLRNFKALSISLEDADEDGTAVFAVTELFEENPLTPERPLLVRTSFPGDMPTNGISYTDESGETRYFSVSESGFDGSLILSEFQRSEKP